MRTKDRSDSVPKKVVAQRDAKTSMQGVDVAGGGPACVGIVEGDPAFG
jgi:hypothetical protein